ncbi:MAG: zeta toxin family protein [Gammaproteobacteria bacterium]|nr:zeta toxin family protein [Gammaproteobacteria bacterium]
MAPTTVVNLKRRTRTPYLRGILTRSLQKAGLGFDSAHLIATKIRDLIASAEEVTSFRLRELAVQMLEAQQENAVCRRYKSGGEPARMLLVRSRDGQTTLFSQEVHRRSLERTGIPTRQARATTARLYHRLRADGENEIDTTRLGQLTHQALLNEFGEESARHYLLWSAFRRSGRPLIILLGGAPNCGKSAVSLELASRLEIVRTQSTDILRDVMRLMIPQRLWPVLHAYSRGAWEAPPAQDIQPASDRHKRIAQGFSAQAQLLAVPCEAVVGRALRENESLIMEGVHLHPTLLKKLPRNEAAIVVPVMLAVLKPEDLRNRISGWESLPPQHRSERYLHRFDDIWQLQSQLLSEADRLAIPIVNSKRTATTVNSIMAVIREQLEVELGAVAEQLLATAEEPASL